MKINKKILIGIVCSLVILLALPVIIYLYVLPALVSNQQVLTYTQKVVKDTLKTDLVIEKPVLKTSPKLFFTFTSDKIMLKKNGEILLSIDKLDCDICLKKLLAKQIILNKLGADDIYVDVNKLLTLATKEGEEAQPLDYKVRWFNSILYLKKCTILYRTDNDVLIKVLAKDLEITKSKNPKYVHFAILTDIQYGNEKFRLLFKDFDTIYMKNKKINIDNFNFIVDKSMVNVNGYLDINNKFNVKVSSNKFKVKNVQKLLGSNLIVANGKELLSCFKDLEGDFDFNFTMTNSSLGGTIKANRMSSKLVPLADIPFTVTKGLVEIGDNDIQIKDVEGFYGKNASNKITLYGDVKNYMKTAKTTVIVQGDAKNDLAPYVSKLIGCKFNLKGISKIGLKVDTDISGKVLVGGGFKVPQGSDVLIENTSISPTKFDRAIGIKLSLLGTILDIEHINYYISDFISDKGRPMSKPLVSIKSNMDIMTGQINTLSFDIPDALPSEFFNVLVNQKVFRRGTFSGKLDYVNTDKNNPYVNSDIKLKDVRVVGQSLSIKNATVMSKNRESVHITADGRFRRTDYKFNSDIQNRMLFPIIVQNIELNLDELDVEKVLATFAPRPKLTPEQEKQLQERMKARQIQTATSDVPLKYFEVQETAKVQTATENEEPIAFQPNLIAVRNCKFNLNKGKYKLINFGNLHANLTLTEQGILEIKSNKFDFAEGISTLKVYCDMAKQKYSIRLGAKEVSADVIATSTLNLPREISGKSNALLEFNTDEKMKLNGRIQFSINDGSIAKLGLVQYVLNMAAIFRNPVAMISPSTLVDLVNVPEGTFKKISGDLNIKDNKINRMIIKSSSPQLSALIFGAINLETFDSSLRIYTKFSNKNKGFAGFLRNISLNTLAKKNQLNAEEISYYASELQMLPKLETGEETAQVFLTTVDGDIQTTNFISALKKIR